MARIDAKVGCGDKDRPGRDEDRRRLQNEKDIARLARNEDDASADGGKRALDNKEVQIDNRSVIEDDVVDEIT